MTYLIKNRFIKLFFICLFLLALPVGVFATQNRATANTTIIEVNNDIELYGARRFGINVGTYDQYGAAQYLKNVIPNPGLEAGEFAMIFLVEQGASVSRVQAKGWHAPWNAQPAGFWDGANYEVLSGVAKGRSGTVQRFALDGGKHTFYLNGGGSAPQVGDAIMVRLDHVDGYYADRLTNYIEPDVNQKRPGSPGKQSLRLSPSFYNPAFYISLDSLGRDGDTSAGKLRIVEGRWKIELWAKAEFPGQSLEIKFHRVQENIFFNETIPLSTQWQKIERTFNVPVGVDKLQGSSSLSYEIRIAEGEGDAWIDDLYLGQADHSNRTAFSDNYVNILRELEPGVLRNWGNQLGSTLLNELAVPTARETVGNHPYTSKPDKFHYSLHEFLELAQAVGAEPWYVIPPTFNGQEMQNLVAYLSAPAGSHPYANIRAQLGQPTPWTNIFPKIHLEYGNEMWGPNTHGDPFLGASLSGGARVGEVADGRFEIMRRSPYFNNRLDLIVGGQAFNPWQQEQIEANSDAHDTIGIAPYFGDLTHYGNTGQMYYPLFANPTQQMQDTNAGKIKGNVNALAQTGQGTELAIYEINSHYTYGWTPLQVRNDYLTSMGMGLALPLHMLTYQRDAGINTQAAFTSLQYSFEMPGKGQRAKLWGLLRDIEATQRKRPGWLGLEMANEAIRGNMISTVQSGYNPTWTQQTINKISDPVVVPYVQSFAYKGHQGDYAMVLFNLHLNQQQTVELRLPSAPWGQATLHTFTATDVRANNEASENIMITTEQRTIGQNYTLQLRPHSMYVIEWQGN